MVDGQHMADGRRGGCNRKHVVPKGSEKVFVRDNLPAVVSGLPDRWRSFLENALGRLGAAPTPCFKARSPVSNCRNTIARRHSGIENAGNWHGGDETVLGFEVALPSKVAPACNCQNGEQTKFLSSGNHTIPSRTLHICILRIISKLHGIIN
jgi:hypothetical protein